MVMSKFDTEKLVGVQLRAIAGDVGEEFRAKLRELYSKDPIGDSCYKWHVIVINYFAEPSTYVGIIQMAYRKKLNLDEYEPWKTLMRMKMGGQFMKLIGGFTQVPQLAVRDLQENRKREEYVSPWE